MQTFIFFTRRFSRNFTPTRYYLGVRVATVASLALLTGCGTPPVAPTPPIDRGTFEAPTGWTASDQRPLAAAARGLSRTVGQVAIIGGDAASISGAPGQWGLRFDADRNDLAVVTSRYASEVADAPATLVLFTTFDDHGTGGPAYFVPLLADRPGTGQRSIDQRATFGVERLTGFVNMRRISDHGGALTTRMLHEIAHQHLAYMRAAVAGSTVAMDLTGRQGAHWHAALSVGPSLLGGYDWLETAPGRFVVQDAPRTFTALDRYGLGLLPASQVPPFFFIVDAVTEGGQAIPRAAQLAAGAVALGSRLDVHASDVVAALGSRRAELSTSIVLAVLTAPGEGTTSTVATRVAQTVDRLRDDLTLAWSQATGGAGTLCTRVDSCASPPADAGLPVDGGGIEPTPECGCAVTPAAAGFGRHRGASTVLAWLLVGLMSRQVRLRRAPRGRCRARRPRSS